MPKKYRLTRTDLKLMRSHRRVNGRFFSLSYGSIPGRATSGAATVVSKKIALRATARNRIKRRAREALRGLIRESDPVFVLIAKKGATEAKLDDIRADILKLVALAREAR